MIRLRCDADAAAASPFRRHAAAIQPDIYAMAAAAYAP